MGYYWFELSVYRGDQFIGTTYSRHQDSEKRKEDINDTFGAGKWTRYNVDN